MKRKALKKSYRKGAKSKMKGTLGMHLQVQLGQVSANGSSSASLPHPFLQNLLESGSSDPPPQPFATALDFDADADGDEKDFILSQDFFCTPDYITPDNQNLQNVLDCNKENIPCPKSPEKLNTLKGKRCPQGGISIKPLSPILSCHQQIMELEEDSIDTAEVKVEKVAENKKKEESKLCFTVCSRITLSGYAPSLHQEPLSKGWFRNGCRPFWKSKVKMFRFLLCNYGWRRSFTLSHRFS